MKKIALSAIIALFLFGCSKSGGPGGSDSNPVSALSTKKDTVSYMIGMTLAQNWKKQDIEVDPNVLAQAVRDCMGGKKTLLTDQQCQTAMNGLQQDVMARQQTKAHEAMKDNGDKGKKFLEENKSKEGVKTTASGLQYKILKMGTGEKPTMGQTVSVNYAGRLIDGTEFDSSEKHGAAAEFQVGQVIAGWNEALQMMPVGSKWQLYIPPDLAYGERGTPGGPIGPNATLIFDVELLGIK